MAQTHYRPIDVARLFTSKNYGRTHDSDEEACKNTPYDVLLFGIAQHAMQHIETVMRVIREVVAQSLQRDIRQETNRAFERLELRLRIRELKHGPCPDEVREYLLTRGWDRVLRDVGKRARHNLCDVYVYTSITPPDKGHALRKEYDRWMKRKAPKTSVDTSSEE